MSPRGQLPNAPPSPRFTVLRGSAPHPTAAVVYTAPYNAEFVTALHNTTGGEPTVTLKLGPPGGEFTMLNAVPFSAKLLALLSSDARTPQRLSKGDQITIGASASGVSYEFNITETL